MKIYGPFRRGSSALSLPEVFVVLAAIAMMVTVLLFKTWGRKARRISCISNLKQIGLANLIFANDHDNKFPWMVSTNWNPTNTSGSLEYQASPQMFRHFQAASNELTNPRILRCPSDGERQTAINFSNLHNSNISYFVGISAVPGDHQMMLAGDRNISGGTLANSNLLLVTAKDSLSWKKTIHVSQGNIGLADGSAHQFNTALLNQQIARASNAVVHLAIP